MITNRFLLVIFCRCTHLKSTPIQRRQYIKLNTFKNQLTLKNNRVSINLYLAIHKTKYWRKLKMEVKTMQKATKQDNSTEQLNIEKALQDAAEGLDENEAQDSTAEFYKWHTEKVTVRTLIKRYSEGKFKLPLCQRLYVWTEKMRLSLYNNVKKNLPCGTIIIAEADGTQYLLDGLQRTTSLILLSNDKEKFTADERKSILDYEVVLTVVDDMTAPAMKNYFSDINSGMALAAVVKQRSQLSDELNNAILQVSSNSFFRETPTNATFNKSQHNELIALNTLLAVAGCEVGDNKAKSLCTRLNANCDVVAASIDNAKAIVERIATIYNGIQEDITERSMNANFIGILVYVMVKNQQFSNANIAQLINYIFAAKRAVKEYSATTSQGAGDEVKCKSRYEVLVKLLTSPVVRQYDDAAFKQFVKENRDEAIKDTSGTYMVAFEDFEECEQQALFTAKQDGKSSTWNAVVKNRYEQLEVQEIKENKKESA